MKIVKLVAENVKRLHAVEISPGDSSLVTIGGKNGAGKSSVLDSIAYAMGGERLVPSEPIRAGESEAKIVVDLGDLVVTRKFKRELITIEGSANGAEAPVERFGETKSTLIVTNKDGARYPSPQAMLDKLLGRLTFDPLAFARDDPKRQDETLRKLVGLDLTPIEEKRRAAFSQRAILKKNLSVKEAQLLALQRFSDAPEEEIPLGEISEEMRAAEEARTEAERAERARDAVKDECVLADSVVDKTSQLISELETRIAQLRTELTTQQEHRTDAGNRLEAATSRAVALRAAVPDGAVLRARLTDAEATNAKVRSNKTYALAAEELHNFEEQIEEQDALVTAAEEEKRSKLAEARFPVDGLGISDTGVTYSGLPFAQASSSEQLRVSVMVGLALNPTLKVLLIRNGNMLDDDSLKIVGELAAQNGAQCWVEWVTGDPSDVAVMLVEGEVQERKEVVV